MLVIIMCPACSKTYSSETFFRYHCVVEHSSHSLPCDRCPKRFPDLVTRSLHLYAHDRSQHSCNLCAEVCTSPLLLYVHVTVVHHYRGEPICHVCKVKLSESELGGHYARTHAGSLKCLEQHAEMFCNVHSSRLFPEEDWALDNMMTWRIKVHQKGLATIDDEPMKLAGVSSIPKGRLSKNKAAALEDHVTTAQEMSWEETVSDARIQRSPLWELDRLNPLYLIKTNPAYELNQMNLTQSSTTYFRGLDQMCEDQSARLSLDGMVKVPLWELNVHDLVYEPKQTSLIPYTIRSRESDLGERNTQPSSAPEISKAIDIYEVLRTKDGKKKLRCVICGLTYEDLDSLLADHRVIDNNINLFYD